MRSIQLGGDCQISRQIRLIRRRTRRSVVSLQRVRRVASWIFFRILRRDAQSLEPFLKPSRKALRTKKIQKFGEETIKAAGHQIGFACKKGLKPESPNQDDFCIICSDSDVILGVFDGHGPYGHDISNFAHETLPEQVVRDSRFKEDPAQALGDAFSKTHNLCTEQAKSQNGAVFDCTLSGTTATVVLQRQDSLHVAHVGDSRAVLAKGRTASELKAEDLTVDHKPDIQEERRRIEEHGGQVRRLEGDIPHRVFLPNKMYPGLAMTRSIGDEVGVSAGVISTPDVSTRQIAQDWRFLVLCSDGVWEFIKSQEAVDIVKKFPAQDAQKSAEALASEAWNRWIEEEGNVVDDITVIVAWFNEIK
mmetsp:Transcript_75576/g.133793  ORF Transcript_75576/g.133793 Transcript_75576/m.133793 type:complete len:362 (-) Transcript_75576:43-1128(-)